MDINNIKTSTKVPGRPNGNYLIEDIHQLIDITWINQLINIIWIHHSINFVIEFNSLLLLQLNSTVNPTWSSIWNASQMVGRHFFQGGQNKHPAIGRVNYFRQYIQQLWFYQWYNQLINITWIHKFITLGNEFTS